MTTRIASTTVLLLVAAALVLGLVSSAFADTKTHEGKIVSVSAGKDDGGGTLVMMCNEDKKENSHSITSSTKIMLDGKDAKLSDLRKGDLVKIKVDDGKVTDVEATREKAAGGASDSAPLASR